MRLFFLSWLLLAGLSSAMAAGRDESGLRQTAEGLDKALTTKDTVFMNRHLSPALQYGHSNGWLESKDEMKANLYNGKLTYKQIDSKGKTNIQIDGKTGLVRMQSDVEVLLEGKTVNLSLSILQVWVYKKGDWILLGRQSTKV